jgi:hypothetical protein
MPWPVQYRETVAISNVVRFQQPETAIRAACSLMDDGVEVIGIGDDEITDSIGRVEIERI